MRIIDQQYQQALDYIYSFIDYSLTRNLRYSPEKFNLGRMVKFMDILGNPQNDYKVIHVAGTKGKGSICAMLASILTCAGYKVGFYSSPHMIDFTERIRVGDVQISREKLVKYVRYLQSYVPKIKDLTTFEIITALAFKYFSDEQVDFAVMEVGMGGRLDATNVVKPVVSVISSISHDHMKVLGSRLTDIAAEKAGIIKQSIPLVLAPQKKMVETTITKIANAQHSRIINVGKEYIGQRKQSSLSGQYFSVQIKSQNNITRKEEYFLPLLGDHQITNALTAYACINELVRQGYHVSQNAISEGFSKINWSGRFEIISQDPMIIVDCAHNRDSFRKFKATIDIYLSSKKKILIFGASEDKEVELMLKIVKPSVNELIITKARHPRALDPSDISSIADKLAMQYFVSETVEEGVALAIDHCEQDSVILAAGSIFIAGAVKEIWQNMHKRDL